MARAFHGYSPMQDIAFDAEAVARFITDVISGPGAVFVTETGMCGGVVSPLYFNPSALLATELVWWAPDGGRELREAFEAWAKESGAQLAGFSALHDDRLPAVTRIFRSAGFTPAETTFLKRL